MMATNLLREYRGLLFSSMVSSYGFALLTATRLYYDKKHYDRLRNVTS